VALTRLRVDLTKSADGTLCPLPPANAEVTRSSSISSTPTPTQNGCGATAAAPGCQRAPSTPGDRFIFGSAAEREAAPPPRIQAIKGVSDVPRAWRRRLVSEAPSFRALGLFISRPRLRHAPASPPPSPEIGRHRSRSRRHRPSTSTPTSATSAPSFLDHAAAVPEHRRHRPPSLAPPPRTPAPSSPNLAPVIADLAAVVRRLRPHPPPTLPPSSSDLAGDVARPRRRRPPTSASPSPAVTAVVVRPRWRCRPTSPPSSSDLGLTIPDVAPVVARPCSPGRGRCPRPSRRWRPRHPTSPPTSPSLGPTLFKLGAPILRPPCRRPPPLPPPFPDLGAPIPGPRPPSPRIALTPRFSATVLKPTPPRRSLATPLETKIDILAVDRSIRGRSLSLLARFARSVLLVLKLPPP
jgi:hypothetical protein